MNLNQTINTATSITVYKDNSHINFVNGSGEYEKIISAWNELTCDAIQMPAYGVSINDMTVEEKKRGLWVEFNFSSSCTVNELPFEKLLVKVEEEYCGFNLIRYTSPQGYFGRCFYLQLADKTMKPFSEILSEIVI